MRNEVPATPHHDGVHTQEGALDVTLKSYCCVYSASDLSGVIRNWTGLGRWVVTVIYSYEGRCAVVKGEATPLPPPFTLIQT